MAKQAQPNPALATADTALLDGDYATAVTQYTSAANDPITLPAFAALCQQFS